MKDRIISAICNVDGQIVLLNWLHWFHINGITWYPMQTRYIPPTVDCNSHCAPVNVPLITADGQVVRNGYSYLGRGKSKAYLISDPLGRISELSRAEFRDLVSLTMRNDEHMLYFDYNSYVETGRLLSCEEPRIGDSKYYADTDIGVTGDLLLLFNSLGIELKSTYIRYQSNNLVLGLASFTALNCDNLKGNKFLVPSGIVSPLLALSESGGKRCFLGYPDRAHSYGFVLYKSIVGINPPSTVYRDAMCKATSVKFVEPCLTLPICGSAWIEFEQVSCLKRLHIKACNAKGVVNLQSIRIHRSEIDELVIDYAEPNHMCIYVDSYVRKVVLRRVVNDTVVQTAVWVTERNLLLSKLSASKAWDGGIICAPFRLFLGEFWEDCFENTLTYNVYFQDTQSLRRWIRSCG